MSMLASVNSSAKAFRNAEPMPAEVRRSDRPRQLTAEQEKLVTEHIDFCSRIASKTAKKFGNLWRDDLYAAAQEALCKAARDFDPNRGAKFETFAKFRINGAVIDEARRLTHSRNPKESKQESPDPSVAAPYYASGYSPEEVPFLTGTARIRPEMLQTLSFDFSFRSDEGVQSTTSRGDMESEVIGALRTTELLQMAKSGRQREVVAYFLEGLTLEEIAQIIGRTSSNVSFALKRARDNIRKALDAEDKKERRMEKISETEMAHV